MVKVGTELYNRCRFKGEHANTGHSLQGDTLDHPFAILEWNHPHATWEWFYTAITRCVRLSDVHIYTGPSLTSGTHKHIHETQLDYKEVRRFAPTFARIEHDPSLIDQLRGCVPGLEQVR
jgi:hypothetical protein